MVLAVSTNHNFTWNCSFNPCSVELLFGFVLVPLRTSGSVNRIWRPFFFRVYRIAFLLNVLDEQHGSMVIAKRVLTSVQSSARL